MSTILVVDDEPTVIEATLKLLKSENYNALSAINVAHAMAVLELNWVDLILLDISMPRKDGTYLFSYLKKYFPSIKVIVYSGYELATLPEKNIIKKEADAFVLKGIETLNLLKNIKEVLKK